ncbi:MAG: amidohydrolase family protein [Planctomycetota bacterium]|nr:amidohydrolase family protein [Planctomycetota bacterium]
MRFFDVHTHAFPDSLAPKALERLAAMAVWEKVAPSHDGTLAGLLRSMDRAGIERAVVCSVATRPEQVPNISRWSVEIASARVTPFASIHPDYPEPEAEIERLSEAGVRGLKFHAEYMGCAVDDARTVRIARAAARAGLAMALHAGYDFAFEKEDLASPRRVRRLHEMVPDLRMLACHMGGWRRWEDALEHVAGLPIYLETSMTLPCSAKPATQGEAEGRCEPEIVERLLEKHPAEYLLFGTDAPWADQAREVEKFLALGILEEAKRRAAWENALEFLGEA